MAISSFYGLQTSLRGLLAQQRSLDVTGHNVANASTKGYSRQEAVAGRLRRARRSPPARSSRGAGAHLGSGVDVQAYRRVRDGFLDLQYRAQATRLGEEAGVAEGLDQRRARARRAVRRRHQHAAVGLLGRLERPRQRAGRRGGAPGAGRAGQLARRGLRTSSTSQLELVGQQAADEFAALTAPGGEVEQIGAASSRSSTTRSSASSPPATRRTT